MQVSKSRTSAIKAAKDAIKTAIKANIMPKGYYIANITGRCHCGEKPPPLKFRASTKMQ